MPDQRISVNLKCNFGGGKMRNSKNYREFLKYLISEQCANDLQENQEEINNQKKLPI